MDKKSFCVIQVYNGVLYSSIQQWHKTLVNLVKITLAKNVVIHPKI